MDQQSIIEEIKENFLKENLPHNEALFSNGRLDSIVHLKLIGFIERKFSIEVTMDEMTLDNFDTLAQIAQYVAKKRSR